MIKAACYWHPECALHRNQPGYHPEAPERVQAVYQAVREHSRLSRLPWLESSLVSDEAVLRVHSSRYWQKLQTAVPAHAQWVRFDGDTGMNGHSLQAAKRSAGTLTDAVDAIFAGKLERAFCLTRPPGHHAMPTMPMGFCLLSNVAIAVRHALAKGFKRVAVVDFDVHHGNGTAAVAKETPGMLMLSSYQRNLFPFVNERAERHERVVLMPLQPQSSGEGFFKAWQEIGLPALDAFAPDLVIFSAGFDAHKDDELAQLNLTEQDFARLTQALMVIVNRHAAGRVISALEGGYNLSALARSTVAHLEVMFEQDLAA